MKDSNKELELQNIKMLNDDTWSKLIDNKENEIDSLKKLLKGVARAFDNNRVVAEFYWDIANNQILPIKQALKK